MKEDVEQRVNVNVNPSYGGHLASYMTND